MFNEIYPFSPLICREDLEKRVGFETIFLLRLYAASDTLIHFGIIGLNYGYRDVWIGH